MEEFFHIDFSLTRETTIGNIFKLVADNNVDTGNLKILRALPFERLMTLKYKYRVITSPIT